MMDTVPGQVPCTGTGSCALLHSPHAVKHAHLEQNVGRAKYDLNMQVIGDEDLATKFEESALTIRRDIIFAASLYI